MDDFNADIVYEKGVEFLFDVGPSLLGAIIVLVIGWIIIKYVMKGFNTLMEKNSFDDSLKSFLRSLLGFLLKLLLIIVVAGMIGIQTTSLIAVIGAAGLAVGLALQGSLANFAGGVILLIFKPFKVDDVINYSGNLGVVEEITILYTKMRTFDFQVIIIPNGQLANSLVTNVNTKERRRVEMKVGISYSDSIPKAKEVILNLLKKDERILEDPAPMVVFTNFGDSSLDLSVRCWTKTGDLWGVYWDNMEKIKEEFDKNDISIPFPQRDVHLYKTD